MTDDPIGRAAEQLAGELPLTGEPSPGVIRLIEAALRQQRADAVDDAPYQALRHDLRQARVALATAEAESQRLRAALEGMTALLREARRAHHRGYADEGCDYPPCPKSDDDADPTAACTCMADAWNTRIDAALQASPQER